MDYDKSNCDINNLISLCCSCHTKTNFNKHFWYVFFMNKTFDLKNNVCESEWEDAVTIANVGIEEIKYREPELVSTFGKIEFFDELYCVIKTHDSHADCDDYIKIPISLIRKIKTK